MTDPERARPDDERIIGAMATEFLFFPLLKTKTHTYILMYMCTMRQVRLCTVCTLPAWAGWWTFYK